MRLAVLLLLALVAASRAADPNFGPDFNRTTQDNMNGEYVLSLPPGSTPGKFPQHFRDYPGGVESFEAYSPPITSLYSQVFWAPLAPVTFPDYIVKKYAGKAVAFVGWEIDQVRRTPEGDVSVPIHSAYNHHMNLNIIGASARFKKVKFSGPDDPRAAGLLAAGHGMLNWDQEHYIPEQIKPSATGQPSYHFATSGNGGEFRKTFHGFAPGYALIVDSPTGFQTTPMQIDTWNRDAMNISGPLPPKFVPGPLPAASLAPKDNPLYSGLLECPMTTRLTKVVDGTYVVTTTGSCPERILTFQECYHAAASLLAGGNRTFVNATGTDPARPAGCLVSVPNPAAPLALSVFFNADNSSQPCAAGATRMAGASNDLIALSVTLDAANSTATITLTGPAGVWFGAGFGAHAMEDAPWTIIVDGQGAVSERKLGNHEAGQLLAPSVTVVRSSVTGGLRTVVVSRPLKGAGPAYYTFAVTATDASLPYIAAVGSTPDLQYHKAKVLGTLALVPVGADVAGACVCPEAPKPFGQASGELRYQAVASQPADVGAGAVGFRAGKCAPAPTTVLIEQRNPTCDIRHYRGGQWACHHMWSLLDADQEIPWTDQPLVYHQKFRFYVQPYTPGYHKGLEFGGDGALLIGSPYEYDVPQCAPGVPGCSLVNGTWIHTITGARIGKHSFVSLNFHCHAPTCLMMSVYACPAGMALDECNNATSAEEAEAKGYKLLCRQEPIYGGTHNPALNGTRFDEAGYIAIPDCEWGNAEQGLLPPLNVTGMPLFMLKTVNASRGHYGEMAGGQPFVLTS